MNECDHEKTAKDGRKSNTEVVE